MAGGIKLLDAVTTGTGTAFNFRGLGGLYALSVEPTGTVSGGAVRFEGAPASDYSGTWTPIGAAVNPTTGVLETQQVSGRFHAVRARVTSNITGGGTVTCRIAPPAVGNED